VLFVDDDQLVLDGLAASLRKMRRQWSMEFVCGGAAAVARIRKSKVDAVVTDMRMPGVDGEAVLLLARARWPASLRIILSGQTERAVVQRTIGVAHQFLSKPCGVDELQHCLQKLLDVVTPLAEETRVVVCGAGNVPVSSLALACLSRLRVEPADDMASVASCIEQDGGLSAKLLHVASGGFFAARQSVTSVASALAVLGLDTTLAVLLALPSGAQDQRTIRLAQHTQATAQLLERSLGGADARLCGVLHSVGKLILLDHFGTAYGELLERVEQSPDLPLHQLERERFGMSHDVVGAAVVELWGISPALAEAIRTYSDPCVAARSTELAGALHLACAVARGCTTLDQTLLARSARVARIAALFAATKSGI